MLNRMYLTIGDMKLIGHATKVLIFEQLTY